MENKLKLIRTKNGLSQEALAEKSGVSVRTIQRLEAGNDGSIDTMNLLASALNVSLTDLFITKDPDQEFKVAGAQTQLDYQLATRRQEFKGHNIAFIGCWIGIMFLWGIGLQLLPNDILVDVFGALWFVGWILMFPIKQLLITNYINPKLDQKYPLTKLHLDKNKRKRHS